MARRVIQVQRALSALLRTQPVGHQRRERVQVAKVTDLLLIHINHNALLQLALLINQ